MSLVPSEFNRWTTVFGGLDHCLFEEVKAFGSEVERRIINSPNPVPW